MNEFLDGIDKYNPNSFFLSRIPLLVYYKPLSAIQHVLSSNMYICCHINCLSTFLIPIRLKSPVYRRIKASLIVGLIISILTAVAPDTAQIGAPFHKYGKPKIAFLDAITK